MSELITLHGGPANGRQFYLDGGDVLELQPMPVLDFSVQTVEPIRLDRLAYRRSLNTRSAFVYQP